MSIYVSGLSTCCTIEQLSNFFKDECISKMKIKYDRQGFCKYAIVHLYYQKDEPIFINKYKGVQFKDRKLFLDYNKFEKEKIYTYRRGKGQL